MLNIPLAAVPNQSLSVTLNSNQYDLRLHYCANDVMAIDLTINEVILLTGIRLVPNFPVIVSEYMQNGNFILQTVDNEYPDYTRFGIDQFLIYASPAELEAINA
jgi:hypothetical protein